MAGSDSATAAGRRLGPDALVVVQWSTLVGVLSGLVGSAIWGTNMENRQGNTEKWQARQEGSLEKVIASVDSLRDEMLHSAERIRVEMADGYVKYETLALYLELLRARNSGTIEVPALPERR